MSWMITISAAWAGLAPSTHTTLATSASTTNRTDERTTNRISTPP